MEWNAFPGLGWYVGRLASGPMSNEHQLAVTREVEPLFIGENKRDAAEYVDGIGVSWFQRLD